MDSLKKRETLKAYFRQGSVPTEKSFADLIDSMVNRLDDGFAKSPEQGLMLSAEDKLLRLVSLYQDLRHLETQAPAWLLHLLHDQTPDGSPGLGLSFAEAPAASTPPLGDELPEPVVRLHLQPGGRVGVGTTEPTERLSVAGFVGSAGRIGTYQEVHTPLPTDVPASVVPRNEVPADGKWHRIISGLDGLNAFEIVAAAYGPTGKGKYSLAHATALSAYGKANSRISHRNAWFRGWFQKIKFRWVNEEGAGRRHWRYGLEIRTASSFGPDARIVYHITQLFDDRRPRLRTEL